MAARRAKRGSGMGQAGAGVDALLVASGGLSEAGASRLKRRSEGRDSVVDSVLDAARAGHKKKVRLGGGGKSGVKT